MDYRLTARAVLVAALLAALAIAVIWRGSARAHDASHASADWYLKQVLTAETRARLGLGYASCCDKGDHYDTRFRVVDDGSKHGVETYQFFHKTEQAWKTIHPDIVQRKKTPDGRPVLFIVTGIPVCFILDEEGI